MPLIYPVMRGMSSFIYHPQVLKLLIYVSEGLIDIELTNYFWSLQSAAAGLLRHDMYFICHRQAVDIRSWWID